MPNVRLKVSYKIDQLQFLKLFPTLTGYYCCEKYFDAIFKVDNKDKIKYDIISLNMRFSIFESGIQCY